MQTFLPYSSFVDSAKCLDNKRLGKQRVEAKQIYLALSYGPEQRFIINGNTFVKKTPWYNHPAVKMWKGHEGSLLYYIHVVCTEWVHRGFKDSVLDWAKSVVSTPSDASFMDPAWNRNENLHAAHRSNLLRKNPEWYGKFGWTEPDNLPYVWPVV